jgi:hypothetical protein
MDSHVKILGILYIIFGALGIVTALVMLLFFGGLASVAGMQAAADPDAAAAVPILGGIGGLIAVFCFVMSVPGLVVGWGLMKFRPWARMVGIVFSAISLISVPIGTLLGIYGLWALLNSQTEALFRTGGPQAPPPAA